MLTHYETLSEPQRRLLPLLSPLGDFGFVLYGGTAVAMQLGHRESIDFDFFTDRAMDRDAMQHALPFLAKATTLQDQPDAWSVQTRGDDRPVKLSFFSGLRFGRTGTPQRDAKDHVWLASLDDLLGHKLKVLLQRVETKDYRDIAALLRAGLPLGRGLASARALFPSFPPSEAIKGLVYFEDQLSDLPTEDRALLVAAVEHVKTEPIPPVVATRLAP